MGDLLLRVLLASALAFAAGCEDERPPSGLLVDAGPRCAVDPLPSVPGDVDGDGVPNDEDDDADGDGMGNVLEHAGGLDCAGSDVDGDGTDNWLDPDSDDDGVPDADENELETDPYGADSDGDGASDLVELASSSDPLDERSRPRSYELLRAVPGEDQSLTLDYVNRIENADVFFLFDTTASMGGELDNLVMGLETVIVPGVTEAIPNVWFGLGGLEDYPVGDYGSSGDRPFQPVVSMIPAERDLGAWRADAGIGGEPNGEPDLIDALAGLELGSGNDLPEAFVPALWATATGEGLSWPGGSLREQRNCTSGTIGYPCFREEALPVIILIGDAAFHNGPDGAEPYESLEAPTYDEALMALDDLGAKVVGVFSGEGVDGLMHFRRLASDTGTLQADGSPMVFEIAEDGSGLGGSVVDGVGSLAEGRTQDVSGAARSVGSWPFGLETSRVIRSFTTGEAATYESKDDTTFYQLERGSAFSFEAVVGADDAPAVGAEAHVIRFDAIDEAGATFATRRYLIVVAPADRAFVSL